MLKFAPHDMEAKLIKKTLQTFEGVSSFFGSPCRGGSPSLFAFLKPNTTWQKTKHHSFFTAI